MGWGIKLKATQWDELDRLRFSTKSKAVFRNCLIILLSDSRDSIKSIARRVGCGYDTVVRMRRLYRKGGVPALQPAKPQGRKGRRKNPNKNNTINWDRRETGHPVEEGGIGVRRRGTIEQAVHRIATSFNTGETYKRFLSCNIVAAFDRSSRLEGGHRAYGCLIRPGSGRR